MKTTKQKNLVMIMIAAVVLVAVNAGIWFAASKSTIGPIDNTVLWGGFVALNVASILWAISLLGLQPFVVALSYVAGGFLAYQGVRGMEGISVAEVTTAGATYGAFGALAIGNITAKVRLAFFHKAQVPFIFIIVGLLVVDALLNSGISSANGSVVLNAVVFPFVIAGVIVGLIWSVLNRFGIGRTPAVLLAEIAAEEQAEDYEKTEVASTGKLVIEMPEHALLAEEEPPSVQVEEVQPVIPAAAVAKPEPVVVKTEDEHFFPLEIDKDDDYILPEEKSSLSDVVAMMGADEEDKDDAYSMEDFDDNLYASGSLDDVAEGGVVVKDPAVSVARETAKMHVKAVVEEVQPKPAPVPSAEPKAKHDDWLGSHLDLLNKLK